MKKHLNKIVITLIAIGAFSLIFGILAGKNAPRKSFENFSQIEFDARPQRAPEVVGKIVSLVGNAATIAKLEQNEEEDFAARREEMRTLTSEERIAEMEARLNAFTGENIVVEIPAGIEITRRALPPQNSDGVRELATAENFPTAEDATISPIELTENDFVAIWLDANISEKNVAEFINLIFTEKNAAPA